MNDLYTWRKSERWSRRELGKSLGVSSETIRRWESGLRIPERDKMVLIYIRTGGIVEPNSFYDLPPLADTRHTAKVTADSARWGTP